MRVPRRAYAAAFLGLALAISHHAHAEPVRLKTAATCTTTGGSTVQLPPGYFLDEADRAALDVEVRRLQDAETRLTAENASMREQTAGWQPGPKTLLVTFATGFAAALALTLL